MENALQFLMEVDTAPGVVMDTVYLRKIGVTVQMIAARMVKQKIMFVLMGQKFLGVLVRMEIGYA